MKIIKPSFEILNPPTQTEILELLEIAIRTCYRSEDKIKAGSAADIVKMIMKSGHDSAIEHFSISVKIACDRGVTHELVRHRLCSFSQSSTRYCNYSKDKFGNEITVIEPCFWAPGSLLYEAWQMHMKAAERAYLDLIRCGASAQEARSVLPNGLKTDIITTANIREWRHIFKLRSSAVNKASHPQMMEIMDMILAEFVERWPVLFGGIEK